MTTDLEFAAGLLKALHFGAAKHRDHRRKDAEASPYIKHPIEVAEVLARVGCVSDLATLQAAILHDTVEDTQTKLKELEDAFGIEVSCLIEEVTDDRQLQKEERKRLQIERAPHLSEKAKQIRIADKISDIRDAAYSPPEDWPIKKRKDYLEWSKTRSHFPTSVAQKVAISNTFDSLGHFSFSGSTPPYPLRPGRGVSRKGSQVPGHSGRCERGRRACEARTWKRAKPWEVEDEIL